MKRFTLFVLGLALSAAAQAQAVHQASGTVTKVDRDRAKLTVQHGPVASLRWPPMTMAFGIKDKAMLDKVKPGEKVEFSFVQSGRENTITEIK
jgi:Cu/Ag efflux protein CusF